MSTPANFKVCPRCNAALSLAATECSVCHTSFLAAEIPVSTYPRPATPAPADANRWVIAMLLAFFLGNFGVHRFYMGYPAIGVAMLGLTLLGILTSCLGIGVVLIVGVFIWAFVDFIMICCNGVRMADGRPLR